MGLVKRMYHLLSVNTLIISNLLSCSQKDISRAVNICTDEVINYIEQYEDYKNNAVCIDSIQVNEDIFAMIYYKGIDNKAKSVLKKKRTYIFNNTDFFIKSDSVLNEIPKIDDLNINEGLLIAFINAKTCNHIILKDIGEGIPDFNCILQLQEFILHPEPPFKGIEEALVDADCVGTPPPPPVEESLKPDSRK